MDSKAIHKLSYGLFVVTARAGAHDAGCIINTAVQAASAPNQLSICVNKANHTHDVILESGAFTVSVIDESAGFELFERFGFRSGRDVDKFADFAACARGENGLLHLSRGANAYISVKVGTTVDLGSHTLFVGEVTDAAVLGDTPSMTYEYYRANVKPRPQPVGTTSDGQTVWRCTVCGYEFVGDELPEDFVCPLCKHPASDFEKIVRQALDKQATGA